MIRRTLRRLRMFVFAIVASVVIALALLMGLAQLAMPWLVRNPERIQAWLSERLHQPVRVGHVNAAWLGGGPVLTLDDVRIGADGSTLQVPRAELALDFYAPFQKGRAWSEFRLVGVEIRLVHGDDGWHVRGFDLGKAAPADASHDDLSMGALGVLVLKDLKLSIDDASRNLDIALAASELRVINRGDTTRIVGKVRGLDAESMPIDLIADVDMNRRSGELYAGGADIDLGRFAARRPFGGIELASGRGETRLWVRLDDAHVTDVRARVDLKDLSFLSSAPVALKGALDVEPRAHLDRVAFVARWMREPSGWSADVADLVMTHGDSVTPARVTIESRGEDDPTYRAGASDLALEPLGALAMLSTGASDSLRRWLYLAHPRGTLAHADVRWHGAQDFEANANLGALGFEDADTVPGIERLDAELHGDASAIVLTLPAQALRAEYPHAFRKPFLFSRFGGDIVAYRNDDAWRVETDRVAFEGEGYGGELRGGVEIQDDGTRPLLDLYAVVTHGEVTAAKLYWPTNDMAPPVIAFLDRALVEGRIANGRAVVRGDLDDWPFRNEAGRFEARVHIVDTTFDYSTEWPRAEKLDATATFVDEGMQVDVDSADLKGVRVGSANASIAKFDDSVLDLSAKASGSGPNLLAFLRDTPVGKQHEDVLKDLALGGKGDVSLTMNLPIKDVERVVLDGSVDLADADLDAAAFNLHFVDAGGKLRFNQHGFAAGPLTAQFRQYPATLSLAAGGYAENAAHAFEAKLSGRFPATTIFADVPDVLPALARFPGEANWTTVFTVDTSSGSAAGRKRLVVSSDLRGIAIDLPEPLAKPADSAQPFELSLDLPYIGQPFSAKLGDVAAVRGRLPAPGKPLAARMQLGADAPDALPARGVVIAGHVPAFDAGGWLDVVMRGSGAGGSGGLIGDIDLRADDFMIADRSFGATHVLVRDRDGATELALDGPELAGTLRIPTQNLAQQGVTARFDRFHWPETPPGAPDSNALSEVAPGSLPPLHIAVGDFMLGKASFGAAEFESYPSAGGMHVDKLESKSRNVSMTASGDWSGTAAANRSHLAIVLTAQNLGHMMDALGFPGLIDGGQTTANIDAEWPGAPSTFAMPKLEKGTIALKVAEGRILEVEPGAGRIFGLLSLTEIPRRLSLDFTDFFKSGLSFNSITGTFRLDDGNAYTSDLVIKSPAADISITGRTGLRTRDYDQEMVVTPHAGATLPIVGALAGGPVGAAAGLVLQGVLGKPIGKAAGSRYHVSGGWDKPDITLIAREGLLRGRRTPKPAAGAKPDEAAKPEDGAGTQGGPLR